jgi:cytoskeletal protein RodZ
VAKARRAKQSTARVLVPLVAGLVLLLGAGVAAWQLWPDGSTTSAQPQSSATVSTAQSTSPSLTSATPSPTPTSEASKTVDPSTAKAQQALEACKQKVAAGDKVIEEAETGVGHWASHVKAQRLADEGEIGLDEMKARFKETRLKGPDDQKRFGDAVDAYEEQDGSCSAVEDAPKAIAASLEKCASRSSDQEPVMSAGAKGMKDWASHLAAMQRNKMGHVADPQGVWLRAYRAAPTNINGFEKAIDNYDPPTC